MAPAAPPVTLRTLLTQARLLAVHQAIVANGGNVTHAARELGVTRQAVYRILKRRAG
jgi:transcriptional regulator of acetoin/glycerol metabolism